MKKILNNLIDNLQVYVIIFICFFLFFNDIVFINTFITHLNLLQPYYSVFVTKSIAYLYLYLVPFIKSFAVWLGLYWINAIVTFKFLLLVKTVYLSFINFWWVKTTVALVTSLYLSFLDWFFMWFNAYACLFSLIFPAIIDDFLLWVNTVGFLFLMGIPLVAILHIYFAKDILNVRQLALVYSLLNFVVGCILRISGYFQCTRFSVFI